MRIFRSFYAVSKKLLIIKRTFQRLLLRGRRTSAIKKQVQRLTNYTDVSLHSVQLVDKAYWAFCGRPLSPCYGELTTSLRQLRGTKAIAKIRSTQHPNAAERNRSAMFLSGRMAHLPAREGTIKVKRVLDYTNIIHARGTLSPLFHRPSQKPYLFFPEQLTWQTQNGDKHILVTP